jgi:hypothetical protein
MVLPSTRAGRRRRLEPAVPILDLRKRTLKISVAELRALESELTKPHLESIVRMAAGHVAEMELRPDDLDELIDAVEEVLERPGARTEAYAVLKALHARMLDALGDPPT